MRYAAGHKQATRARLLAVGGSVVKKNGFATTGVDSLMEAVGLTGGAFYSHFSSKSDLLQALIEKELGISRELLASDRNLPLDEWIEQGLKRYISYDHVKHPETGCPLPALSTEVARSERSVKRTYENTLSQIEERLAARAGHEAAWAAIAQCVGAIVIARAMATEATGKKVIEYSRGFMKKALLARQKSDSALSTRRRRLRVSSRAR